MHKYRYCRLTSYGRYVHRSHVFQIKGLEVFYKNEDPRFYVKFNLYPLTADKNNKISFRDFVGHKRYFTDKINTIKYTTNEI